jgi:hypothetical protein
MVLWKGGRAGEISSVNSQSKVQRFNGKNSIRATQQDCNAPHGACAALVRPVQRAGRAILAARLQQVCEGAARGAGRAGQRGRVSQAHMPFSAPPASRTDPPPHAYGPTAAAWPCLRGARASGRPIGGAAPADDDALPRQGQRATMLPPGYPTRAMGGVKASPRASAGAAVAASARTAKRKRPACILVGSCF